VPSQAPEYALFPLCPGYHHFRACPYEAGRVWRVPARWTGVLYCLGVQYRLE